MMRFATFLALSLFIQSPSSRAAGEATKTLPEPTKEERAKRADMMDKMAEVHQKMAECLRTDKPMAECHEQMKKECPMAKDGDCPMMDGMPGMRGMHHRMNGKGRMRRQGGSDSDTKQ